MCYAKNVRHNFHSQSHSLTRFDVEIQEHKKQSQKFAKCDIHGCVSNPTYGIVKVIYDIRTLLIDYNTFNCKKYKMADICLPPYISDDIYLMLIKYLNEYFDKKGCKIVQLYDDYVYLYYEDECVNTMINNMIVYHCSR
jgi:hypothetical protein